MAVAGGSVFTSFCLSIFSHAISKNDAARITKIHTKMFQMMRPGYSGGQKVNITSYKNIGSVGLCTLVSAGSSN